MEELRRIKIKNGFDVLLTHLGVNTTIHFVGKTIETEYESRLVKITANIEQSIADEEYQTQYPGTLAREDVEALLKAKNIIGPDEKYEDLKNKLASEI